MGAAVAFGVAFSVGAAVGFDVAFSVGFAVAFGVACSVGFAVAFSVGAAVVFGVDFSVGLVVAFTVETALVFSGVGVPVGAGISVGARVSTFSDAAVCASTSSVALKTAFTVVVGEGFCTATASTVAVGGGKLACCSPFSALLSTETPMATARINRSIVTTGFSFFITPGNGNLDKMISHIACNGLMGKTSIPAKNIRNVPKQKGIPKHVIRQKMPKIHPIVFPILFVPFSITFSSFQKMHLVPCIKQDSLMN